MSAHVAAERRGSKSVSAKASSQAAKSSPDSRGSSTSAMADPSIKSPPSPAFLRLAAPRQRTSSTGDGVADGRLAAAAAPARTVVPPPSLFLGKRTPPLRTVNPPKPTGELVQVPVTPPPPVFSTTPPGLPSHPALDGVIGGGCNEREEGIVESTRSYLARLSLEDAAVALARLQQLMMRHTAAVTASREGGTTAIALPPSPRQAHVDPFKLSTRPLEDIAEELCTQLCQLGNTYEATSAAERSLLGLDRKCSPSDAVLGVVNPLVYTNDAVAPLGGAIHGGLNSDMMGTFGPMISTMQTVSAAPDAEAEMRHSGNTDESWGVIDLNKANPGPCLAVLPVPSTQCTYPDGTTVSFPRSTFGDLVSTGSGPATSRSANASASLANVPGRHSVCSVSTQTDLAGHLISTSGAAPPLAPMNIPALNRKEPAVRSSAAAASTMDQEVLRSYLKALESRLTEKQRLEALREARGAKRNSISGTLLKLAASPPN